MTRSSSAEAEAAAAEMTWLLEPSRRPVSRTPQPRLTWGDQSRCRDIFQRQPMKPPARRITARATPPKIHGDDEELASAASTAFGWLGAAEAAAPLTVTAVLGELDSVAAVAVGLGVDAVGRSAVATGDTC